MSKNMRYLGLCSTCKDTSSCTFPRDPDTPIFYCEEFKFEKTPLIKPPRKEQPPAMGPAAAKDKDTTKLVGLCSDCENCQTCVFPKPEGGIWHCEEYK